MVVLTAVAVDEAPKVVSSKRGGSKVVRDRPSSTLRFYLTRSTEADTGAVLVASSEHEARQLAVRVGVADSTHDVGVHAIDPAMYDGPALVLVQSQKAEELASACDGAIAQLSGLLRELRDHLAELKRLHSRVEERRP